MRRPGACGVPPLRRDGRADSVDSAAAGAVQDLRPAGRRRGNQAGAVRPAIAIGRARATSRKDLLAVWYGEQALGFIRDNGKAVALVIVVLLVVALGAYFLWRKGRSRTPLIRISFIWTLSACSLQLAVGPRQRCTLRELMYASPEMLTARPTTDQLQGS